jgi:hypothetical protein
MWVRFPPLTQIYSLVNYMKKDIQNTDFKSQYFTKEKNLDQSAFWDKVAEVGKSFQAILRGDIPT